MKRTEFRNVQELVGLVQNFGPGYILRVQPKGMESWLTVKKVGPTHLLVHDILGKELALDRKAIETSRFKVVLSWGGEKTLAIFV